jgi:two-component system, OmpR family, phosphate regulon response regulator PhoB
MKILIIEDNTDLRDIYSSLFTKAGHQIAAAENGLDGVVKAVDFKPDIVLLDLMMPEMNGYDFLKALADNTSISPYIIIVSNLSQQTDIDLAKANGAHEYIRKSDFAGEALVKEVERLYKERMGKVEE